MEFDFGKKKNIGFGIPHKSSKAKFLYATICKGKEVCEKPSKKTFLKR